MSEMAGSSSDHGEVLTIFEETFGSVVEHEVIKMILQSCDWDTASAQTALLEMIDPSDLPKHIQSAVVAGSIVSAVRPGNGISVRKSVDTEISEDVCGSEGFWETVQNSHSGHSLRDTSESPPLESLDYVERVLAESKTEYLVENIEENISEDMSKWLNIDISNNVTPVLSSLSSSTSRSSSPHTPEQIIDVSKHNNSSIVETASSSPSKISPPELPSDPNSSLYNTAKWVLAPEFKPNAFWGQSETQGPLAAGLNRSIGQPVKNWEPVIQNPLTKRLSEYAVRKNHVDNVKEKISSGSNIMIILRGLPGSGKSSLGRELRGGHGAVLSTDDFFCDRHGTYHYDPSKITEAHTWNKRRALKRISEGKTPVIIDNTNMEIWEFRPYIKMGLDAGYEIEILEPDTPWKFTPNILAQKNTHGVPKQKIIQMKSRFQQISSLENLLSEVGGRKNTGSEYSKTQFLKSQPAAGSSTNSTLQISNKNDSTNNSVHLKTKRNNGPANSNTKTNNSPANSNIKTNNSPTLQSTKTTSPSMSFKYREIKKSPKRNVGLNQDLISEYTKTNSNISNIVNGFVEERNPIYDTASPLHLKTSITSKENASSIIPTEIKNQSSTSSANLSSTQNGLSLLQNSYLTGQTFLSDDEGLELDDGPDVIIEDDSDEEQDQIPEKNKEIKLHPSKNASNFGQDALGQSVPFTSTDMATAGSIENETAIYSKDNSVDNFVMPETTRDEEDEIEKMLIEAELLEKNNDIAHILNKEPENHIGDNENDAEKHKKEAELIIENIQYGETDSDWGDEENEDEDDNENNFKDLVQSFGSALKIQIENKSCRGAETHIQQKKTSNADDEDAAMYEFCNTLEEKIGENLASLIIRPTDERENYTSLFSVIGNDEIKDREKEDKSMISILNTTQAESISSLDENVIIDLNQALNAHVVHEKNAFDKPLDANSNIQTNKDNLQAIFQYEATDKGSNESQLATGFSSDKASECLDNISATLQTPGTDSNFYTINSVKDAHENKQQKYSNFNQDLIKGLDKKESIVDVNLSLENLKITATQSTSDIPLSNISNKDVDSIVKENDSLQSWECVSANAGECSIEWDAAEGTKEKESEPRGSKPSRDRRKRTGGDPSKWMMSNSSEKEPESPELSSWVPIESGQVSWDTSQNGNKVFDELKAIITEHANMKGEKKISDASSEGKESSVSSEIKVNEIKKTKHMNERDEANFASPEEVNISKASVPDLKTLSKEVINKKDPSVKVKKQNLSVGQSVSTTSSPKHTASYTGAVPKVKRRAHSQSPNHLEKSTKAANQQDFPFNTEHGVFDEKSAASSALSEGLIIMGEKGMFLCTACESPILSIKTLKQHYLSKKHLERQERWKHHNKKTFSSGSGFELSTSSPTTPIKVEKITAGTQTLSIDFQALQLDNNLYEVKIIYGRKNYIPASNHDGTEDGALTKGNLLLDKGTMTDGDVDVTIIKPLQNLIAFFPQINVEELEDVLEKCQNNCDWAINVLLDSGYEVANNIDTSFSQEDDDADIEPPEEGETFSDIETSTTNDTREEGGSWGDNELSSEEKISRVKVKQSQDPNALASKKQIEEAFEFANSVDERVTRLTGKEYSSLKLNQVKKTKNNKKSANTNKKRSSAPSSPAPRAPSAPSSNLGNVSSEGAAQYVTLVMDPLFALQLSRMFGPADTCLVDGECLEEDRRAILPLELCHQIHTYWAKTLDGKFKHESQVLDQIIREDELLAKRLQEEENVTQNVNIVSNGDEAFQKDPPLNFREIMELEKALKESESSSPTISKEPTLSTRVNLQILCTEFPHVDPKAIEEQFKRCSSDYQSTEAILFSVHGAHREEPKNIVASDIVLNDQFIPGRVSPVNGPPVVSYIEEEYTMEENQEDFTTENPQVYRDEARVHYEQRQENYKKAQEAASRGMKAAAAYYARLGNEHAKELKKANQRASQKILEAVNQNADKDANKIDLHLLHVKEALSAAQAYFDERERILFAQGMSSMKVQVVTGYGVNSAGNIAKIKPAIKGLLDSKKYEYWLPNPGMFEITLKSK